MCLSAPIRLLTLKRKGVVKPKLLRMFLGAEVMSVLILAQRVGRLQYDGRRICQHWVGRRSSLDVGALRDRLHRDVGGRAVAGVVDLQSGACCGSCSKRRAAD